MAGRTLELSRPLFRSGFEATNHTLELVELIRVFNVVETTLTSLELLASDLHASPLALDVKQLLSCVCQLLQRGLQVGLKLFALVVVLGCF